MTHPHPILASRLKDHDRQVRDLAAAERASRERIARIMVPCQAAIAEWETAGRLAVLEGREPPPRPTEPDLGADQDAAILFHDRRRQLHRDRLDLLAAAAADIERDALARERQLLDKAKELFDQFAPIVDELDQLRSAVRDVAVAVDAQDARIVGSGKAARMRPKIELVDVLEAVTYGSSLLGPAPIPPEGMIEAVVTASAPEPQVRARVDQALMRGVEA
jgi:hypothetical protein